MVKKLNVQIKEECMQIYKKNGGVTLLVLAITIIVLLILVGITLNFGLSSVDDVTDDRSRTELAMVEQAIVQQYTLLLQRRLNASFFQ